MSKFRSAQPAKSRFYASKTLPPPASTNDLKPVFSFEFMANGNGFSVPCCNRDELGHLAQKLFTLSQMTWVEIIQSGRHGLGTEKIATASLKTALPAKVTEDVTLLALRYNGLKAMVGYRDDRIFHILFIDHNFTLYDHG